MTDPFADKKTIFQQLLDHQQAHYRAELDSGQCLSGPHKDDVLSELDARRQDFVLNQIRSGQVLITCCEPERITNIGKRIFVEGGQIREEASCT